MSSVAVMRASRFPSDARAQRTDDAAVAGGIRHSRSHVVVGVVVRGARSTALMSSCASTLRLRPMRQSIERGTLVVSRGCCPRSVGVLEKREWHLKGATRHHAMQQLPRRVGVHCAQVAHMRHRTTAWSRGRLLAQRFAQIGDALRVPPGDVRRKGNRRVLCSARRYEVPLARLDALEEDSRHALSAESCDAGSGVCAFSTAAHDVHHALHVGRLVRCRRAPLWRTGTPR